METCPRGHLLSFSNSQTFCPTCERELHGLQRDRDFRGITAVLVGMCVSIPAWIAIWKWSAQIWEWLF